MRHFFCPGRESFNPANSARTVFSIAGPSRCLDAFKVALNQACDGGGWYVSTEQLQLSSLPFCVACRSVPTMHLKVDRSTPARLFSGDDDAAAVRDKGHGSSKRVMAARVPALRARKVTWQLSGETPRCTGVGLSSVELFVLGDAVNDSMDEAVWSDGMRSLSLGQMFDQPISNLPWPVALREIVFGNQFDQPIHEPIDQVVWPSSLQQLALGDEYGRGTGFNQPIHLVSWPASLLQVTFGRDFKQPIREVNWPSSLQRLEFKSALQWPEEGVTFPASLRQIEVQRRPEEPLPEVPGVDVCRFWNKY
ncbi:unnamed protein product [Ectocarpus sp. CCAP 1310/34]|nr:unnamed protein product [Ectocarpus sp. CCAP 1310/34]